jgi:hypothetical protein
MNGYSNHATWNANLWYGDQIADYVDQYQDHFTEISISEMADDLESFCWEIAGMNELPIGFVRDAASQEWNQINWRELGEKYISRPRNHWSVMEDIEILHYVMEDCE